MKFLLIRTAVSIFLWQSLLVMGGAQTNFSWPEGKKAALSLSFDDARLSNVDVGLSLFKKNDVQVTYYVVPSGVEKRLEKWKQAVIDGHEIGNHTIVHPCSGNFSWSRGRALEDYSLASMREELMQANQMVNGLLGVTPRSFAYTCGQSFVGRGASTRSYVPLIAELFVSGRGWLNEAANDPWFVDLAQVQGIEMDGKDFKQDIQPILDQAIEENTWVVLAGHEIGEEGRQTTKVQMLEELMAFAQDEENSVWLATVGEVADYIRNQRKTVLEGLASHLTFFSSFDHGATADFSKGDHGIFTAPDYKNSEDKTPGIQVDHVSIAKGEGRFGNALQFDKKADPVLFFEAKDNVNYRENDWSGTISLWLSLNPEQDLEPGYCDPIQITDVAYNDAALWVDFSDKNPRQFRMGVFGDLSVWNPQDVGPDQNPDFTNRLVVAQKRPFGRDVWTHVVITFENLNSDNPGTATFYINGQSQGSRKIAEPFTWDLEKAKIYLGLNYIGKMDEVSVFDRALTPEEIQMIFLSEEGLGQALKGP